MPKGKNISDLLKPLAEAPIQAYFGSGLHTLGLLQWILRQTGPSSVFVSSYSTSEAFLSGCRLLRDKGLMPHSLLLLDQRAARKTLALEHLMCASFEHVFLGQNHSKITLVHNRQWQVSVVTSQNQTYGGRAECTLITTDAGVFQQLKAQFNDILCNGSVEIDIEHGTGIITEDRRAGAPAADTAADWRPFDVER